MIQRSLPIIETIAPPPRAPADARADETLRDAHGRSIRDLRISVTDRCNYRCVYCMDPDVRYMPKMQLLTCDEYARIARICVEMGVTKLRLTGGEPLLYPDLDRLIETLGALPRIDLALTTNGSLLTAERADRWARAGLDRLTFSLDTLRPERIAEITRSNATAATVPDAIAIAHDAGLGPIKVNCVVMKGVNDDEFLTFAEFAREHAVHVRFIEFMPLDSQRDWSRHKVIDSKAIINQINDRFPLNLTTADDPSSTSVNHTFADGAPGSIGIIAPISSPFCGACSRLRLTADGGVRPCLFSHDDWNIRGLLRSGASDEQIRSFLIDATWTKQPAHGISAQGFAQPTRTMSAIGG